MRIYKKSMEWQAGGITICGLSGERLTASAENKKALKTGNIFHEIDTDTDYMWEESTQQWYVVAKGGGGGTNLTKKEVIINPADWSKTTDADGFYSKEIIINNVGTIECLVVAGGKEMVATLPAQKITGGYIILTTDNTQTIKIVYYSA